MDKFLPHGTRVPKKKTNEDDDNDEEPEMGRKSRIGEPKWEEAEVPDLKTSLENADLTKKNHGLENAYSTKKNHWLIR